MMMMMMFVHPRCGGGGREGEERGG